MRNGINGDRVHIYLVARASTILANRELWAVYVLVTTSCFATSSHCSSVIVSVRDSSLRMRTDIESRTYLSAGGLDLAHLVSAMAPSFLQCWIRYFAKMHAQ